MLDLVAVAVEEGELRPYGRGLLGIAEDVRSEGPQHLAVCRSRPPPVAPGGVAHRPSRGQGQRLLWMSERPARPPAAGIEGRADGRGVVALLGRPQGEHIEQLGGTGAQGGPRQAVHVDGPHRTARQARHGLIDHRQRRRIDRYEPRGRADGGAGHAGGHREARGGQ